MHKVSVVLPAEADTIALGNSIGTILAGRGKVFLTGDLGAGKTTLCRGILRALGHDGAVKSPTFTLVEPYEVVQGQVYHFDLYRLIDPDELEYIGIDDYFGEETLCLVEWPEKADGVLPESDLDVVLKHEQNGRIAELIAHSINGMKVIDSLST